MSPLDKLIHELSKLPGVGSKTALRLALFILRQPTSYPLSLSQALKDAVEQIRFCHQCTHFSHRDLCDICHDQSRHQHQICVVEESSDLLAIERSGAFKGTYHVLQGVLSPLDGVGPEDLKIKELIHRIKEKPVEEIILATNPTVSGDATSLYLSRLLQPLHIKLTRLASGLPLGADIQYVDHRTLSRALEMRTSY